MIKKYKFLKIMILALMFLTAGCLQKNEENKTSTVKSDITEIGTSFTANTNFEGAEFLIDAEVNQDNVKAEKGNLVIVKNIAGKTMIAVTSFDGIAEGEKLFTIEGLAKEVNIEMVNEVKEVANADIDIKRAGEKLLGDFNGTTKVEITDFTEFATNYLKTYNAKYDIAPAAKGSGDWANIFCMSSPDSKVDIYDFVIFGKNYGKTQPGIVKEIIALEVTGTTTVKEKLTTQLTANAKYSDGSTEDVTAAATWTSSSNTIATVSKGLVSGVTAGNVVISAAYSGKSGSANVKVEGDFDGVILYVNAATAPTIWCWEDGGKAISQLMGYTWETQPAMTKATEAADGWYKFEIKSTYLTGGKSIKVMLNKADIAARTSGTTGWYKSGQWTDENPDKPVGPKVSLSPAGGTYKGTQTITITIEGNGITAKTATFGTKSVTLSVPTTTIKLSDYITADKGTAKLTVSATNGDGTGTASGDFTRDDNPVVVESKFSWDNATVYFVMTDRFYNGDTSNDHSYGRRNDYGSDVLNSGSFLGGDIKGMTTKLEEGYFTNLGVNAIWITAPYEQAHGWTGGGPNNDFPHYAYHGYYPLDWTMMDKNMGTVEEFRAFVDKAHEKGIRVVMDIVMNHVGYHTLADAVEYGYAGVTMSISDAYKHYTGWGYHSNFQYKNRAEWDKWWSEGWLRAGTDGSIYGNGGQGGDLKINTSDLPDVKTESTTNAGLAPILKTKWSRETSGYDNWIVPAAKDLRKDLGVSPADYQVKWLAAWVREFGIDGFRADTAKHVDLFRWKQLKDASNQALKDWRAANPTKAGAKWTENFWMTGEVYDMGYGYESGYATNGFDSLINFTFPKDGNLASIGNTWKSYAEALNSRSDWNTLSYISSHDKGLFAIGNKVNAGTALVLSPGAVQIYYGDENDRNWGPGKSTSDSMQGSRGQYQWGANANVLSHWQKIGQFRNRNIAVGAGSQIDLGSNTYGRIYNKNGVDNKVVINVGGSGSVAVNVSGVFADGTAVKNAYNGETGTVSGGKVTFTASNSVILIEKQ